MSESRTLARKREIRARVWRGEDGLHGKIRGVPRRRGRASQESLPRGRRVKREPVSGRKGFPGRLQNLGFTPTLAKFEIGKEVGRRRARSHVERVK